MFGVCVCVLMVCLVCVCVCARSAMTVCMYNFAYMCEYIHNGYHIHVV